MLGRGLEPEVEVRFGDVVQAGHLRARSEAPEGFERARVQSERLLVMRSRLRVPIVEVTIDEKGSVADMRVLQSLKRDIDEKCVATLRNWRFRPAMLDGVAISSRQDVHFHFPS